MRRAGFPLRAPPHLNNHGSSSLEGNKVSSLFRSNIPTYHIFLRQVGPNDIQQLILKFGKDFEICGYETTLSELREVADKKTKLYTK